MMYCKLSMLTQQPFLILHANIQIMNRVLVGQQYVKYRNVNAHYRLLELCCIHNIDI